MKLQTRLLLAQLPLALALTLLALLAVTSLTSLGVHAQSILKDNYRSVLAAQQLKESLERLDSGALFMLAGEREAGGQLLTQHRPRFVQSLQVAQDNITEPGEKERVESLTLAWKQYETALTQYLTLQSTSEQKTFYFMRLSPAFLLLKEQADAVLTLNQDAMIQRSDRVERLIDWVRPTLGGGCCGGSAAGRSALELADEPTAATSQHPDPSSGAAGTRRSPGPCSGFGWRRADSAGRCVQSNG